MTGKKLNGGTTIAGTMIFAHLAGIKVFATGGLGGVHRGGENSMDISADLTELGRTPVAVISSGCKSFLDIPRTLEYLETQGVGVSTFADGRSSKVDFPAFWTRDSGTLSPSTVDDEREAAAMIFAQSSLGLSSGLFFANPIPAQHSIPKSEMDKHIAQAIQDAEKSGSTGSDNTPFILAKIRELTAGNSITANQALIESNIIRGTRVACELARLESDPTGRLDRSALNYSLNRGSPAAFETNIAGGARETSSDKLKANEDEATIVVAGSLAIDLACDFLPAKGATSPVSPQLHTSNPAKITQHLGGVGLNVATAIKHLGTNVQLCSVTGDDEAGATVRTMLAAKGFAMSGIIQEPSARTSQYVAVNDGQKNLVLAMADMSLMETCADEVEEVWKPLIERSKPRWLVLDANWNPSALKQWIMHARAVGARIAYEPVSVAKSRRLFVSTPTIDFDLGVLPNHTISLATPNHLELASMHTAAQEAGILERDDWWQVVDAMGLSSSGSRDKLAAITSDSLVNDGIPQQSIQLLPLIPTILTKLGNKGILITQMLRPGDDRLTSPAHSRFVLSRADPGHPTIGGVYMKLLPSAEQVPTAQIVSVNGVGDTFLGVIIAGLAKENPRTLADIVDIAQQGSVMTLKNMEAVSPEIAKLKEKL
ncbi:MAG: hypothetical protein Q9222_001756 [Ikaeria aurantiellina]